jgi:hypothetical protein
MDDERLVKNRETGPGTPTNNTGNIGNSTDFSNGGAHLDAFSGDLAELVNGWSELPEDARRDIMAIARRVR